MGASKRVIPAVSDNVRNSSEIKFVPWSTRRKSGGPMYTFDQHLVSAFHTSREVDLRSQVAAEKWVASSTTCSIGFLLMNMMSAATVWLNFMSS